MARKLFCIFIAGFWTAFLFTPTVLTMLVTLSASASMFWLRRVWSPVLLWAGGARLEVHGLEHLPAGQPVVFVCNHQSTLDIPALFVALPADFRFVSKKSLKYVPFLGWYMQMAKFVFVDRANRKAAVKSLEEAGAQIRGGISVALFPEGTRSEERTILPFKKGPFALAVKAGVPVIPVTIEGTGKIMPKNSWDITPGPVKVMVGAPIDPRPFGEDREALMRVVRDVMIDQSLALGGPGGDREDVVAAQGREGVGRATQAGAASEAES